MAKINFSELKKQADDGFGKPSEGEHLALVETIELSETKGGRETFKVRYRIDAGPDKGKVTFGNVFIPDEHTSQGALFHFFRKMLALGFEANDLDTLTDNELQERAEGRKVVIELVQNGEWLNVNDVKAVDAESAKDLGGVEEPPPMPSV